MRLELLEKWVRTGSLFLHMPGGVVHALGQGEPSAHMVIHRPSVLARMMRSPELAVGEGYMDGDWEPGEGGLLRVLEVLARNYGKTRSQGLRTWLDRLQALLRETNSAIRSRRNVHHHYDLDETLFRSFLDADMHYSCAYFEHADMDLEAAQKAKCRHIAGKLLLRPGDEVLDIGSGWGGLALYLAAEHRVRVTGLTLSENQLETSRRRARELGLADRVSFQFQDYRLHTGLHTGQQADGYDAIVSVGMFEHVGRPQYRQFFDQVKRLLKPEGRVLLHTIGRSGPPAVTSHWIQKYIFPGAYIPALSEVAAPVEHSGLVLNDLEVLRLHYAETLRHWNARFQQSRREFLRSRGERFCRMWEFYLQACEAMFRWGDLVVFHLQLTNDNAIVPITRDYLHPGQEKLSWSEQRRQKKAGSGRGG